MVTVYGLRCKENGFVYVGCTECSVAKRMREHRCRLRSGTHRAGRLLADWARYGEASFETIVLQCLDDGSSVERKREAEMFWLREYDRQQLLYNDHVISFRPSEAARIKGVEASRTAVGDRWSEATNLKRRLAQLGKPKGHGAKISATKRKRRDSLLCIESKDAGAPDKEPVR